MKMSVICFAGALVALAACARNDSDLEPASGDVPVTIALQDPGGRLLANGSVSEENGGVRVRVEAAGLVAGTYAVHLHQAGSCEPPDFQSAGPHWNPTGRQHGRLNPMGPHLGDLPNLTVGVDGAGSVEFVVSGASLGRGSRGLSDEDGTALVVHAGADDYRTDPSGNSGARLACGVVAAPR
jgi:Cu-Zn family superoxide dismutase